MPTATTRTLPEVDKAKPKDAAESPDEQVIVENPDTPPEDYEERRIWDGLRADRFVVLHTRALRWEQGQTFKKSELPPNAGDGGLERLLRLKAIEPVRN